MNNMETNHCLHLDVNTREDARRRLLSIRGHLEGILRMLENESIYCVEIGDLVMKSHLKDHVVTAHERGDVSKIVDELMEVLKYR